MKHITDFGREIEMTKTAIVCGKERKTKEFLPRYAMWTDEGQRKMNVVECSNDLEYLRKKYEYQGPVAKINMEEPRRTK